MVRVQRGGFLSDPTQISKIRKKLTNFAKKPKKKKKRRKIARNNKTDEIDRRHRKKTPERKFEKYQTGIFVDCKSSRKQ